MSSAIRKEIRSICHHPKSKITEALNLMRFLKHAALLFIITLAVFPLKTFSAVSDPLKSVPSDITALFSIDVKKLIKLPIVQEMRKNNQEFNTGMLDIENKLKSQGILIDKLADKLYIFAIDEKSYGAVFSTEIKESQMEGLFAEVMKTNKNALIDTKLISGKKVFVLNNNNSPAEKSPRAKEVTVMTYLQDDVILFSTQDQIVDIYKKIKDSNITSNKKLIGRKDTVDKNAIAWLIFELPQNKTHSQNNNMMLAAYDGKVSGGNIALTLTGKESKDIGIDANLECIDAQTSSMMALQLNALMMFALPQNAQFSSDLVKAVKIQANDKNVTGKIFLSSELQGKLKDFFNQQQGAMNPMQIPAGNSNDSFGPRKK